MYARLWLIIHVRQYIGLSCGLSHTLDSKSTYIQKKKRIPFYNVQARQRILNYSLYLRSQPFSLHYLIKYKNSR